MTHICLLGDSVFDNEVYVRPHPDTPGHLRRILPDSQVTLVARDGATTRSLPYQLKRIPDDATHLVVSVGGNNALVNSDLLHLKVSRQVVRRQRFRREQVPPVYFFQAALSILQDRIDEFADSYYDSMDEVLDLGLDTTVCTIYNPDYETFRSSAVVPTLAVFNDVITRYANSRGLPVIELRDIMGEPEDFENDIEPSVTGGRKIAQAIATALAGTPAREQQAAPAQRLAITT